MQQEDLEELIRWMNEVLGDWWMSAIYFEVEEPQIACDLLETLVNLVPESHELLHWVIRLVM